MKNFLIATLILIAGSTSVFAQTNVVNNLIRCGMYFELENNPKYDKHQAFIYKQLMNLNVSAEDANYKRNRMMQMVKDSGASTYQTKQVLFESCKLFFN